MKKKNTTPAANMKDRNNDLIVNDLLKNKLSGLVSSNQLKVKTSGISTKPMPKPTGVDGVDHININDAAFTKLGKMLRYGSRQPFNHSHFGEFNSIEGFWQYIRSVERDDRLRDIFINNIRVFIKQLTFRDNIANIEAIILDAYYQKISNNSQLYKMIKSSTLPFETYYVNKSQVRIRNKHFYWIMPGLEEIRNAIRENRLPDLKPFYTKPDLGLFDDVLEKHIAPTIPEKVIHKSVKHVPVDEKVDLSTVPDPKPLLLPTEDSAIGEIESFIEQHINVLDRDSINMVYSLLELKTGTPELIE